MCSIKFTLSNIVYTAPPGPPDFLDISSLYSTSFTMSWALPSSDESLPDITGFDASCSTNQGSHSVWSRSFQGNSTLSVAVTGLEEYTGYTCCVSARNSGGTGVSICENATTSQAGMWHGMNIQNRKGQIWSIHT